MTEFPSSAARPGGIPRGLSRTGPILFSYGFRPFFLGGAIWAAAAMVLWIAAISGAIEIGGDYGAPAWHAHEMLFGFSPAILAGFLLTAVPNWTGRLPVSGRPLLYLFLLWCAGRVALLIPDMTGETVAVAVDSLFLPTLLAICLREVVAGRKWKDLKVVGGLLALSLANVCYHYETLSQGRPDYSIRLAISAYVILVTIVGGRMIPSFTRNWINRFGRTDFPVPYNTFDAVAIIAAAAALALWVAMPEGIPTAVAAFFAAALHFIRLGRWRGWTTFAEMLVAILHAAYLFVPLGLAGIGLSALDILDYTAALHILNIGTVAGMMLAVMTRATRGHTGRVLSASRLTTASYMAILLCALVRPLAGIFPAYSMPIYAITAALWIGSFAAFLVEHGPMLVNERRKV